MTKTEPWQTAEMPGPKRAAVITQPEVAVAVIKRAKRPLLIVGQGAAEVELEGRTLIEYLIDLARSARIPVVASGSVAGEFLKRGFKPAGSLPAVDVGNRLTDAGWKGLDGEGPYDVALFVGLPYAMESTILSGLKHFAPWVKTITLDNVYQPHATWSFSNISQKNWIKYLKTLIENFAG